MTSQNKLSPSLLLAACAILFGCKDDDAVAKPDGAVEASRMCEEVGEAPDCDICEFYGWYGDGECDGFCSTSDVDCAADAMVNDAAFDSINVPDDTGVEIPDAGVDGYQYDGGNDAGPADGGFSADTGVRDGGGSADAGLDASFDSGFVDGGSHDGGGIIDAGGPDARPLDAFPGDGSMDGSLDGSLDGGIVDGGDMDGSLVDGGLTDSGIYDDAGRDGGADSGFDSGVVDAGPLDSGLEDGGLTDTGIDSSTFDGSVRIDSGVGIDGGFDSGVIDAGGFDVGGGFPDVGVPDGSFGTP